jgi:RNA polymerase sigma-70 factor (ECF subfamily)
MQATTATPRLADSEASALVRRFQAGDATAFEGLYTAYFGSVYAYLKMALRDSHEAEDATQQVFAAVFDYLPRYQDRGKPFRAWLFTIARHQGLASRRQGQARPCVTDPVVLERTRERAAQVGDASGLTDEGLLRLVESLPDAQRQVLFLRFAFDFQHPEIAAIVGRSPEAVRQLLTRALKTLRARFGATRARGAVDSLTLKAA